MHDIQRTVKRLYGAAGLLGKGVGRSGRHFGSFTQPVQKRRPVPALGTKAFENLCSAIARLAAKNNLPEITTDAVKAAFLACEDFAGADKEALRQNFNALLSVLPINLSQLCQYTNYDASAIFRIRNGTRKPADADRFAAAVASFVTRELQTAYEIAAVAELIGCETQEIDDLSVRYAKIKSWLLEQPVQRLKATALLHF